MLTALDAAGWILSRNMREVVSGAAGPLTSGRLFQLMYFAQTAHSCILKRPLFEEDFERWKYGPVVPSVYREYRRAGKITSWTKPPDNIPYDTLTVLEQVFSHFRHASARKLGQMLEEEFEAEGVRLNTYADIEKGAEYFERVHLPRMLQLSADEPAETDRGVSLSAPQSERPGMR